ncbi:hypothetical protein AMTRI_Chr03g145060 [Amborella trichopoda]
MAPRHGRKIRLFSSFGRSINNRNNLQRLRQINPNSTAFKSKGGASIDQASLRRPSGSESTSSSDDDQEENTVINVDLEFFDPKPDDFHGLKMLLNNYLDVKVWDLSGFVDLILGQTTVGTVVKLGDDGAPFGFISAINLERYKDHRCIVDLKSFLLDVCREKSISNQLKIFLGEQAQGVGLLVSQRVVNLPLEILPPLYDALFDEVSWATEDEPTQEQRDSFQFKYYLIITRIYQISHGGKPKGKGALGENEAEPILYNHLEDEIFNKLCSWSFTFQLHDQQTVTHELRNYRQMGLVMVVKADKQTVDKFRDDLKTFISDS